MKEFCKVIAFAITLTALVVTFSVALWNEGCNQQANPQPFKYTGIPGDKEEINAGLPMLDQGQSILILPQ